MKSKFVFVFIFVIFFAVNSFLVSADELADGTVKNAMFADVSLEHQNFYAIYYLYNMGVIEGYQIEDSTMKNYKPGNNINRAEFLKLILEGTGQAKKASYDSCFPDVKAGEWYTTYICQAKYDGVINGYPDGTFKPDQPINEVEAIKILGEVLDWELANLSLDQEWYEPYFDIASNRNIAPENDVASIMDRGDIAEMVFRNDLVETLGIDRFDTKFTDEFFYGSNIPFGGPFGPGGIFGPGGPFGVAGAFYGDGYFADSNGFSLLGDSYYDQKFCYVAEAIDFVDRLNGILNEITDGNIEYLKLEDFDTDDLGMMICHDAPVETGLVLLTEELRAEYGVQCWSDTGSNADYEDILCYVEPEQPIWLDEDSFEIVDTDGPVFASVSQNGPAVADGKDSITVSVNLNNENGVPVVGHTLNGIMMRPYGSFDFKFTDKGNGLYQFPLTSYGSGEHFILIKDALTGDIFKTTIVFEPGTAEYIVIDNVEEPFENSDHNAYIVASLKDKYGNTVKSNGGSLTFSPSLGEVNSLTYDKIDGTWHAEIGAEEWGNSTVTISQVGYLNINESVSFNFEPIYIGSPRGVELGEYFDVPVYVNMGTHAGMGFYDLTINFDPDHLNFINAVDGDTTDDFSAPDLNVFENEIRITQETNTGDDTGQFVHVADLKFKGEVLGGSTIFVEDATLHTVDEEIIEPALPVEEEHAPVVVKDTKSICVEAYTLEGSDNSSIAEIINDTNMAEEVFREAAESCNCPFYIRFALLHTEIPEAAWKVAATGTGLDIAEEDDIIEEDEMDAIATGFANNNSCIQVFYVPQLLVDDDDIAVGDFVSQGWSSFGRRPPDYITSDNSRDHDDLTLAHEFLHAISGNSVVDYDPRDDEAKKLEANNQGADQDGNLMNYEIAGTNITPNQCNLVNWANYPNVP